VSNSFLMPAMEEQTEAGPLMEEKRLWSSLPTTPSDAGMVSGSGGAGGS